MIPNSVPNILAKIIDYLKTQNNFLCLKDILEEINESCVPLNIMNVLNTILINSKKIEHTLDSSNVCLFKYKPLYLIDKKNVKKSILELIKNNQLEGKGGILYDDLKESFSSNLDNVLKSFGDDLVVLVGNDKKKIIFFNDKSLNLDLDKSILNNWNEVSIYSFK